MTIHGFRVRLIAVPMLVLAVAGGCSGKPDQQQVASAGGNPRASAGAGTPSAGTADGREFARCVRAEGVEMPDPGPDGMIGLPAVPAGDEAAAQKMDAAMEKCREFLPDGGEPPKPSPEDLAKALEYAKCVREHGLPDFPDPDPETGGFRLKPGQANDMKDLGKASESCQQFGAGVMPGIEVSG
jgi:hypothetical protein